MPISQIVTNSIASGQTITSPVIAGTPTGVGVLTSGTAQASTSGTSIDFTSIPSWVKRITVMMQGVSTNGTSHILVQIGTSGGVQTSGYTSTFIYFGPGTNGFSSSNGFGIYSDGAANFKDGAVSISLLNSSNGTWAANGMFAQGASSASPNYNMPCSGSKTLSGTLDRVRITTVNGTDTFDAGTINILYE